MTKFYNREPWNLIIGFAGMAFFFILVASITSPWVLVVPFLLLTFFFVKVGFICALHLRRKGYFSGRRVNDDWIYEERHGNINAALHIRVENTEPGHYEIFFPSEQQWRVFAPLWALDRRIEIARRVAEAWKASDFHMSEGACPEFCV